MADERDSASGNPYQPPKELPAGRILTSTIADRGQAASVSLFSKLLRVALSAIVGLISGGGSGFVLSFLFVLTPLQRVLGPRYSEFDFFGVIGVTVLGAVIACVGAAIAGLRSAERLRAAFRTRNLFTLVLVPAVSILVLTLSIDGEWAWLGLIHLSACLGILAGAWTALLLIRSQAKS